MQATFDWYVGNHLIVSSRRAVYLLLVQEIGKKMFKIWPSYIARKMRAQLNSI